VHANAIHHLANPTIANQLRPRQTPDPIASLNSSLVVLGSLPVPYLERTPIEQSAVDGG